MSDRLEPHLRGWPTDGGSWVVLDRDLAVRQVDLGQFVTFVPRRQNGLRGLKPPLLQIWVFASAPMRAVGRCAGYTRSQEGLPPA
jgi:hypothetical protein